MNVKIDSFSEMPDLGSNQIIGNNISLKNSSISFRGEDNILFLEDGANLNEVSINFSGNNSLVYIRRTSHACPYNVNIYNNSVFYMGKDNYINSRKVNFQLSEERNIIIGDDNMFSYGVAVRIADPHLIYSTIDHKRVNPTKSVYIGDHVWIGQDVKIFKGSIIGSGSIIAGEGVVTKNVPSNTIFGGNSGRILKKDIFWEGPAVHAWTAKDTEQWHVREHDDFTFTNDGQDVSIQNDIENQLNGMVYAVDKLEYLKNISEEKNRFFVMDKSSRRETFWYKLKRAVMNF